MSTAANVEASLAVLPPLPNVLPPRKRTPVPLLLSSFPSPPSHVPSTPLSGTSTPLSGTSIPLSGTSTPLSATMPKRPSLDSVNPPLSTPPSAPLPPVPGPSRISEYDAVMLMASTRSRRSSRASVASSQRSALSSPRSSTFTQTFSSSTSAGEAPSDGSSPKIPSAVMRRSSITSSLSARSLSSVGSTAAPTRNPSATRSPTFPSERSPSMADPISEEDFTSLDDHRDTGHRRGPTADGDIQNILDAFPAVSRTVPLRDEALSSIDMPDLPADDADVPSPDARSIHHSMRAHRSRSEKHKAILRSRSTSPNRMQSPRLPSQPVPPLPTRRGTADSLPMRKSTMSSISSRKTGRSESPDISDIIAATPRPRRTSSANISDRSSRSTSRSRSRPRSRSLARPRRMTSGSDVPALPRTSTVSVLSNSSSNFGRRGCESPVQLAYHDPEVWDGEDDSFVSDYGVQITRDFDDDLDGNSSDSSIDLHTPLPQLMVRHGLLSPNSKLLPKAGASPLPLGPDERPGSVFSVASTAGSIMTKSGHYKDERDTLGRRMRHKDGKTLRGGLGLTTGLGWSDSEDEDAPSALTRRISSLNLTRKSTSGSLRSSASQANLAAPRKKSGALRDKRSSDESVPLPPPTPSTATRSARAPPTSWSSRRPSMSRSSSGSNTSLTLAIPTNDPSKSCPPPLIRASASDSGMRVRPKQSSDALRTPSSSSTLSIPLPTTPADGMDVVLGTGEVTLSREKTLPPLPGMTKKPSALVLKSSNKTSIRRSAHSSSSSAESGPAAMTQHTQSATLPSPAPHMGPPTAPLERRPSNSVRPLKLPQSATRLQPGEQLPRSGQVLTYNRNLHDQQRLSAAASQPSGIGRPPTTGLPRPPPSPIDPSRPRPRIGAGMVYRTSSSSDARSRLPHSVSTTSLPTRSAPATPRTPSIPRPVGL